MYLLTRQLVSISEFAAIHGATTQSIIAEIKSGRLKTVQVGNKEAISYSAAMNWLELLESSKDLNNVE